MSGRGSGWALVPCGSWGKSLIHLPCSSSSVSATHYAQGLVDSHLVTHKQKENNGKKPRAATSLSDGLKLTTPEASWVCLLGATCRAALRHHPAQRKYCAELESVTPRVENHRLRGCGIQEISVPAQRVLVAALFLPYGWLPSLGVLP